MSTGASSASPSSLRPPRTASSSSATMTRASTAGGWPTFAGSWGWPQISPACGGSTSPSTTAARPRRSSARCGSSSTIASASRRRSVPARTLAGGWSLRRSRPSGPARSPGCSPPGPRTAAGARCWRGPGASSCRSSWRRSGSASRSGPTGWSSRWRIRDWTGSSRRPRRIDARSRSRPGWRRRHRSGRANGARPRHSARPSGRGRHRSRAPTARLLRRTTPSLSPPGRSRSSGPPSSAGRLGCRATSTWRPRSSTRGRGSRRSGPPTPR